MVTIEDHIVLALRRISQAIDQWSRHLWQEFGLTSPQLATLREVVAGTNVTPMTLAGALHVSQPTVTGILHRLEERGLIQRRRSATDRRSIIAVATAKGRKVVGSAPSLLRDRFCSELARLPDWEQTQMLAMLQRVAEMMHAPEVRDAPFFLSGTDGVTTPPARDDRKPRGMRSIKT